MIKFFYIRDETDDGIEPLEIELISNIPTMSTDEYIPLGIRFLKGKQDFSRFNENNLFSLLMKFDDLYHEIALFRCFKKLPTISDTQWYLTGFGETDILKINILELWNCSINVNWLDLDKRYAYSWISICRRLASKNNWLQKIITTDDIIIDAKNLRSKDDFYCYLGEKFFGYRGYAGGNLDALHEVLKVNNVKNTISIENNVFEFLRKETNRNDYFSLFINVLRKVGCSVVFRPDGQ